MVTCRQSDYIIFHDVSSHVLVLLCVGDIQGTRWCYCLHGDVISPKCTSQQNFKYVAFNYVGMF
jgi:hypothetical protein